MTTGIVIETEIESPVIEQLSKPEIEVVETTDNYGKFAIEPLERGFGVTLGNSLRRVLLGSLPGAAVTAVQIEGVQHEYTTLPDVREDVAEILLNIKGIRLRAHSNRAGTMRLQVQGPGMVTAGDIQPTADYDVVNPELHLATLDSPKAKIVIEFFCNVGKGFVPAAPMEGMPIGVLSVDAIYAPIRKVSYVVEKTRVGQVTDYERLVLEVTTDGSKTPEDVVREAGQILVDSFHQFASLGSPMAAALGESSLAHTMPSEVYNMAIERLELSARTLNCLKRSKINKVGEVLEKSHDELLKIKNFGEKSLVELYARLEAMGLKQPEPAMEATMAGAEAPEAVAPQPMKPVGEKARRGGEEREGKEPSGRGERLHDLAALRALLVEKPEGSGESEKKG